MKRSLDCEKICQKKLLSKFEQGYSSVRKLGGAHRNKDAVAISQPTSRDPLPVIELEKEVPASTTPPFFESLGTDSFRTRISTKLWAALNGFVSDLQNVTQSTQPEATDLVNNSIDDNYQERSSISHNDENITIKLALQNFIHSAKSQISGLLSKQQKISNENSSSNIKPFNVDPLQTQISLKLQELLCNSLDNRRFDNNSNDLISETELQNLSHLLQDFVSSAKKKLSFSLNANSRKQPTSDTRSSTCIAESASEIQLSQLSVQNTSDKQQAETCSNEQEINKRLILQHCDTDIGSDRVKRNSLSKSLIVKKAFRNKESYKKIQVNKKKLSLSKETNLKSSIGFEATLNQIDQINTNQLLKSLSHHKSCQIKGSNKKCHKSKKIIRRKRIPEDRSRTSTESTFVRIDEIQQSQPLNPYKTCHTKELHRFNSISNSDSEISDSNSWIDFRPKAMESYYGSDSSSRDGKNGSTYMNGGILLLSDCERTPDFLDLNLEVDDSDVDEPVFQVQEFIHSGYADRESDSDEDVIVLGEKRKTYQEITLDEDDDGEVYEKVIELEKPTKLPKDLEDLLYDCPKCDKKFRVESLLKFHVRMHSVVESHGRVASPASFAATETETVSDEDCISIIDRVPRKSKSSQSRHPRKENKKLNSKSSHKHKNRREKNSKKKSKMSS